MTSNGSDGTDGLPANRRAGSGCHEEFLQLAAVSTTGDLSPEEEKLLREHVANCEDCRQALKQFEAVADVAVPMLASELEPSFSKTDKLSTECSQPEAIDARLPLHPIQADTNRLVPVARRNGGTRSQVNWNFVWLPLAAAVLLTVALGIFAYRFGKSSGVETAQAPPPRPDLNAKAELDTLERQLSDAGHERGLLKAQLAERDALVLDLRRKMEAETTAVNQMQAAQSNLENSVRAEEAGKQQAVAQERDTLKQDLNTAEASLRTMRIQLDAVRQSQSDDQLRTASLENQIKDLNTQLRERERAINKDEELLAHDRDVRDLMGARDLYIAEVYDVGRDAITRRPYGRVFYTRGKSLVFYAYDLDQQAGGKSATFQAWGRRGPETEQALPLGIFYKDDVGKKRWALKFDDPKLLDQIDAVFVTLEPNGERQKPTGKPLLFAYLHIKPNHP